MPAATTKARAARTRPPTVAEQHAEWLNLLGPDGPFLALHVLTEAFGQGLPALPTELTGRIRQAWAELTAAPDLLLPAWVDLVLGELLRYPPATLRRPTDLPGGTTLVPNTVACGPDRTGGSTPRMYVYRLGWDKPVTRGRHDQPSPAEQAAALCRATAVPLALLTNGRHWVLVHAREGERTGVATGVAAFDADLWLEEPILLRAFAALCSAQRVLPPTSGGDGEEAAGAATDSLAGLFARSARAQAKITDTLGGQVRQAVELLVGEFARLDREAGGALLRDVAERDIYRAALTVLMRLVFLLYAEESRLLPVADPIYAGGYAVSARYERLTGERALFGDEVVDRRSAAWFGLLALFAAVHGGCEHPDLRIPAYGGSLFDPDRFGWLARVAVTDRVVFEVLDALLVLRHRGRAAERLSYQSLDVEQIGHVYEGLLEFSCRKVDEPYLGLAGKREPELPLSVLRAHASRGGDHLMSWLVTECGTTPRDVTKRLAAEPKPEQVAALHAACDNDSALTEAVRPFLGLLRTDLRGAPAVFPAGSVLFTKVEDRRDTGTHYTPRVLAEEIVEHALAPLCFAGPAEGEPPGSWRVRTADELLALRICDPAMGSGAFLVSACRYLAERLVAAWDREGIPDPVRAAAGPDADRDGLLLAARRLVAARCLFGVDRDDMAVELAKLSLWLVTLAKDRPFGFLDHALRLGDSLVGLTSESQVEAFHLDPERGREANNRLAGRIDEVAGPLLTEAANLRERIEATVVADTADAREKAAILARAQALTDRLRLAADAVAGAALASAGRPDEALDDRLTSVADEMLAVLGGATGGASAPWSAGPSGPDGAGSKVERALRATIDEWLTGGRDAPIRPLHWPLEFPEIMRSGGFHAVVGNPPFSGGTMISGRLGKDLLQYIQQVIANGRRAGGRADLCTYFLLRDVDVARPRGRVGIIATKTIAQGDSREVGLDHLVDSGRRVYRAVKSQPWPGAASVRVSLLWVGRTGARELPVLDGRAVRAITPSLDPVSRVTGNPHRLAANAGRSFIGSYVLGDGFFLEAAEARALIERDPRNAEVLFPYLSGKDLNSRPDCSGSRWVINFHDWPIDQARGYALCWELAERTIQSGRLDLDARAYPGLQARWWQFWRPRAELYRAIAGFDRVLVIARVSSTAMPAFVPTAQVLNEKVVVFITDRPHALALLSSEIHVNWAWRYSATLKADLQYSPSDVFDALPHPGPTKAMDAVGEELDSVRAGMMRERNLGLTALYNLVHDPDVRDADIARLRDIQVRIDHAVRDAYATDEDREPSIREFEAREASEPLPTWADLDLDHGFHATRQGVRFTVGPAARDDILDKLLALNHYRHAQESRAGTRKPAKKSRRRAEPGDGLF